MRFDTFTIKDGLSQGLVVTCMQDKEGFMWFTTKDGLNKYDGYTFTVYRHNDKDPYSLPENYVTQIIEDDKGYFWVATSAEGLYLFDKKNERFYPVTLTDEENISNETIWHLEIVNSVLYVSRSAYVYLYDISHLPERGEHALKPISLPKPLLKLQMELIPQKNVYSSKIMPDKSFWIKSNDSVHIYVRHPNHKTYKRNRSYHTSQLSIINSTGEYDIYPLPNPNHKLINDKGNVFIFDFVQRRRIFHYGFSSSVWPSQAVIKDKIDNYWLISDDSIISYIDAKTYAFTTYKNHQVFQKINKGYTPCFDNNNRFWLGTTGYGVLQYDYRKHVWNTYKKPHNAIYTEYRTNELLYTTDKGVPSIYNIIDKTLKPIMSQKHWMPHWSAWCFIHVGADTFIGLLVDNSTGHKYLFSYNAVTDVFTQKYFAYMGTQGYQSFLKDKRGTLWLTCLNESHKPILLSINPKKLTIEKSYYFPAKTEFHENAFASDWFEDKNGVLWFATLQGLFSFDKSKEKWQHFSHIPNTPTSFPASFLFSICPDPFEPDTYIWIGTDGNGLLRFNRNTYQCTYYTEEIGLSNNVVYRILPDSKGNLWLSTNKGLCCMPPIRQSAHLSQPFIPFTVDDGLPDNEFNRYEGVRLSNGDLFFGGMGGKVFFTPEKVLRRENPSTVMITNLMVYNKVIHHKDSSSILPCNISYAPEIRLNHEQSMFTLSFALLNYSHRDKKRYKYILEGFNKEWIDAGTKNEATYTNLPPGTYTFRVTGTLLGQPWNNKEATLSIIILPAWWQTWWFYSTVTLIIFISLYGFYRYRLKQQTNILLLRNRIAGDLHDEIGSTLSSISLAGTVLQKKLKDANSDIHFLLLQINKNTATMMESMSDIVWAVNTSHDSFDDIIHRMRAFTSEILEPKDCMAHFKYSENIRATVFDMNQRKNVYLIFKEAINNIAKYAEATHVWVSIHIKDKKVTMSIRDDGKGFDMNGTDTKSKFSGNGLHTMRKRAEELKGALSVLSEPDKGTEIILNFTL